MTSKREQRSSSIKRCGLQDFLTCQSPAVRRRQRLKVVTSCPRRISDGHGIGWHCAITVSFLMSLLPSAEYEIANRSEIPGLSVKQRLEEYERLQKSLEISDIPSDSGNGRRKPSASQSQKSSLPSSTSATDTSPCWSLISSQVGEYGLGSRQMSILGSPTTPATGMLLFLRRYHPCLSLLTCLISPRR